MLATAALTVLLGMAAFAVDLGWMYMKSTEAKKAAEAAALAGVVHMPKPGGVSFVGSAAWVTAIDVAARNGYTSAGVTSVTPSEVSGRPNQLHVDVATEVPTFFMKIFGLDKVTFTRGATAETLPALKLGSDEAHLGTDPGGDEEYFWVAINGERRRKEDGDPFSTRCIAQGCVGTTNGQFQDPAYYYGVEVAAAGLGPLLVEVYDAPHSDDGANLPGDLGFGGSVDDVLELVLYAPDQTPNDPTDNPTELCRHSFTNADVAAANAWVAMPCSPASVRGVYVLTVAVSGDDTGINSFSLRASAGGSTANVAVFGLGTMSLWMQDAGTAPNFKVVKLEEIYAGTQLVISLFDPGDVTGGSATLRFLGEAASMDCRVRIRDQAGNVLRNWGGDDSPGSAPCEIQTAPKIYNDQWVDLAFDVPDSYTCGSCWVTVDYDLDAGANVTERTTWTARINGQPIHLLP